ncbi:MAG: MBL fold metallo-hydrolase [Saprospiraceae bacterium]|nr:MBL fold metallo-hydrolase [Saprospiraceae bacterium]
MEKNMIRAYQSDYALLVDIQSAPRSQDELHLWWLGQSGFLINWHKRHVLLDPYLSDSLTVKYQDTDKPHVRMSERAIDPYVLDFIDIVTSSHNHTDHLDADTLRPLLEVNPELKLIVPEANRDFVASRLHIDPSKPIGMRDRQSVNLLEIRFHGLPAAHNDLDRDSAGNPLYMGYVIKFGDIMIYHSGDTLWHDEILSQLRQFDVHIAILPINGNNPKRRVAGNLNAEEAVKLALEIGADVLIPCHYDMFFFNTADVNEFAEIAKSNQQPFRILKLGERFSFFRAN